MWQYAFVCGGLSVDTPNENVTQLFTISAYTCVYLLGPAMIILQTAFPPAYKRQQQNVQLSAIKHCHITGLTRSAPPAKGGVEITPFVVERRNMLVCLTAKTVQGTSLPLQSIHHIKGSDSFASCVLCVSDSIPDDIFQKYLHSVQKTKVNNKRKTS